jgi:hypothetical protein
MLQLFSKKEAPDPEILALPVELESTILSI